jgi:long-subunit acyl-CoA synthetase (AMP-forming)
MLCYTSGTTGDAKGVKLTHWGLIVSLLCGGSNVFEFRQDDVLISYLPSPHSYEQALFNLGIIYGCKIGYY